MLGYALPPLGDCRYCSLDVLSIGTIASLAALALGLSSFYWSSSDLTSSEGTGTGLSSLDSASSGLSSSEMVGKLVI